jgi:cell division protein FtsW
MVYFFLCLLSMVEMFSASSQNVARSGSISAPIMQHVTYLIIGAVFLFIAQAIPYRYVRMMSYFGLIFGLVLLLYTTFKGVVTNDAARWMVIGGIQFQPSEIAKLCLIIVIADFVDRAQNPDFQKRFFPTMAVVVCVICGLIFPENLSTTVLLFSVVFLMLFISGMSFKRISLFAGVIIVAVTSVFVIAANIPEQKYNVANPNAFYKIFHRVSEWEKRIKTFGEPTSFVINDNNQQVVHAQIAIARSPVGPGNSVQRNRLPEASKDFIFAIIVEEMGILGGGVIILLYMTLLFRAGVIARKSQTIYPAVLVIGIISLIVLQAFLHIGVNVRLGPVTGLPLPLISRGGTSIVMTSIALGIVQGIARHVNESPVSPKTEIISEAEKIVDS